MKNALTMNKKLSVSLDPFWSKIEHCDRESIRYNNQLLDLC